MRIIYLLFLAVVFITAEAADTQRNFIYSGSPQVGIGTSLPASKLDISTEWSGANTTNITFSGTSYADQTRFMLRRANGSLSAPTAVSSGDVLGNINFRGHDGTNFSTVGRAAISAIASETYTPTAQGTLISFSTTLTGTTTSAERMRVDNAGNVGIGTTTPGVRLDVAGEIRATGVFTGNGSGLTNLTSVIKAGSTNFTTLTAVTITFASAFPTTNYTATCIGNGFALASFYVSAKTTTAVTFTFGLATGSIDWQAVMQTQ